MSIAARSAPNNGRVKEAKVSSCTRCTGKALNRKAKRDVNRRANGDERRDIREDIRQVKREDENKNIKGEIRKGRREDKFGDKERNGKERGGKGKYSQTNSITYIFNYISNIPNFINNLTNISKYIILMFQI